MNEQGWRRPHQQVKADKVKQTNGQPKRPKETKNRKTGQQTLKTKDKPI
jgi:hypothetical protein